MLFAISLVPILPAYGASASPRVYSVPTASSLTLEKQPYLAGYQAVSSKPDVIGIESTWIEPEITCNANSKHIQYNIIEAVLDANGEHIAVGSDIYCLKGSSSPIYLLSDPDYTRSGPGVINGGDVVIVSITYVPHNGTFVYNLNDITTGFSVRDNSSAGQTASMTDAEMVVSVAAIGAPYCSKSKAYICPQVEYGNINIGSNFDLPFCPGSVASPCVELKNGTFHPLLKVASTTSYNEYVLTNYAGTRNDASTSSIQSDHASFTVTFLHPGP